MAKNSNSVRSIVKVGLIFVGIFVLTAFISLSAIACKKEQNTAPPANTNMPTPKQVDPEKVGPATIVPKGVTADKYVNEYYTAYKAKKWAEAYKMLPAVNKAKEDEKSFTSVRETMPITEFTVTPVKEQGDTQTVEASYNLGAQGKWTVIWTFKNTKDGLVAEGYQAQMSQ